MFTKIQLKQIEETADKLDFSFKYTKEDNYFCFEIYSPQGQDFVTELNASNISELKEELCIKWSNYNPDEEAILWYGVGKGEPKSLSSLLKDMKWCKRILGMLKKEINKIK